MKIIQQHAVKTHIISGFLGAGKTTLLQNLLSQKPANETWAILMNEFGHIGIDQQLLPQQQGYVVKELLGGCLCCSSQLPMQIALSRLIQDTQPDRLFIEPTGLGHSAQLLEQLTEPHWQSLIAMQALVGVINGSRLKDTHWIEQDLYQDQLKAAQIVVVSHTDLMDHADDAALSKLKHKYQADLKTWIEVQHGVLDLKQIEIAFIANQRTIQPLLQMQRKLSDGAIDPIVQQLPYHYVETAQGYTVAGWKLPQHWQFDFYQLLDVLCEQSDWLRIKGIFQTNQGWMSFNFNPTQLNYKSVEENIDNRLEIITQHHQDWNVLERALLDCKIDK